MSNSPLVDYTRISANKNVDRIWHGKKYPIKKITIHHMAGNLSVETCGKVFGGTRKASSNYGIGSDGRVGLYVDEKDRPWTSSSPSNDYQAITIEVANNTGAPNWTVSDAAYAKLIDLCVDICKRNGIKKLVFTGDARGNLTYHQMFASTACPGPYLKPKFPKIAEEVNRRLGTEKQEPTLNKVSYDLKDFIKDVQSVTGSTIDGVAGTETLRNTVTVSSKKNNRHPVVKFIQKRLFALGYTGVGTIDGVAGSKFDSAVKKFQKDHGCIADGEITSKNKTWKVLLGII